MPLIALYGLFTLPFTARYVCCPLLRCAASLPGLFCVGYPGSLYLPLPVVVIALVWFFVYPLPGSRILFPLPVYLRSPSPCLTCLAGCCGVYYVLALVPYPPRCPSSCSLLPLRYAMPVPYPPHVYCTVCCSCFPFVVLPTTFLRFTVDYRVIYYRPFCLVVPYLVPYRLLLLFMRLVGYVAVGYDVGSGSCI